MNSMVEIAIADFLVMSEKKWERFGSLFGVSESRQATPGLVVSEILRRIKKHAHD